PLSSRVVAVSDTYDAMTSTRVYRKGLGHQRAIDELQKYSGIQFDPDCVRAFLDMYADTPPSFPDFPSVFSDRSDAQPVIVQKERSSDPSVAVLVARRRHGVHGELPPVDRRTAVGKPGHALQKRRGEVEHRLGDLLEQLLLAVGQPHLQRRDV